MTQQPTHPEFSEPRRRDVDVIQQLHEIPDLAIEAALTRDAHNPTAQAALTSRTGPGSRPPTDLDVLDALRPGLGQVHFELNQAVRAVWEDHRDLDLDEPSVTTDSAWLIRHESAWRADPFLTDWVSSTVKAAHHALTLLVRQAPPLRLACPRCSHPVHREAEGAFFRCEAGHIIDHHAEIRRMGALQDLPIAEIAEQTGIPESTLHRWAKDGWITPINDKRRGRLFTLADVRRVAERVRR